MGFKTHIQHGFSIVTAENYTFSDVSDLTGTDK